MRRLRPQGAAARAPAFPRRGRRPRPRRGCRPRRVHVPAPAVLRARRRRPRLQSRAAPDRPRRSGTGAALHL